MTPDDSEARSTADILLTIGKVEESGRESSPKEDSLVQTTDYVEDEDADEVSAASLAARRTSVVESLTLEDVQQYFSIPLKDAAVRLGISMNSLKRACRKLGISKWPYRQLRWLERNKSKMELALRQHPATAQVGNRSGFGAGSSGSPQPSTRHHPQLGHQEQHTALHANGMKPMSPPQVGVQHPYRRNGTSPDANDMEYEGQPLKRSRLPSGADAPPMIPVTGASEEFVPRTVDAVSSFAPPIPSMQPPFTLPNYNSSHAEFYTDGVVGRPRHVMNVPGYFPRYHSQFPSESAEQIACYWPLADARFSAAARNLHPAFHRYIAAEIASYHQHAGSLLPPTLQGPPAVRRQSQERPPGSVSSPIDRGDGFR